MANGKIIKWMDLDKCTTKTVKLHIKDPGKMITFVEVERFIMIGLNILVTSLIIETFHKSDKSG
jgi:hypothetical protein